MDGRKNNGNKGHSTKATNANDKRLASKTERQEVYDLLNPHTDEAIKQHVKAIKDGEKWAIELFYKYQFNMPTKTIDTNISINDFDITKLYNEDT